MDAVTLFEELAEPLSPLGALPPVEDLAQRRPRGG